MKLVKESLYETFTQASDPIEDLGIGIRAQIKKWFKTWAPSVDYEIDDEFNITIEDNLDLRGTQITKLPDNLSVGGWLDIRRTSITKLPDNLKVGESLYLGGTQITELPDNLKVGGYLDLRGTKITELPDNITVGGQIYL